MTKARLYRARHLLPISHQPIEDGGLLIEAGRISAVGPFRDLRRPGVEIVDFGEAVMLPPMANAHTHLELSAFPGWAEAAGEDQAPATFVDWILQLIRVKRNRPPADFLASLEEGVHLSLQAGTGAVGDILSFHAGSSIHRDSSLFGRLFFEVLGVDAGSFSERLTALDGFPDRGRLGALEAGLSPHAPYTLSPENLRRSFVFAAERGLPTSIHLAESVEEIDFLRTARGELASRLYPAVGWAEKVPDAAGQSPGRYLAEQGGLSPSTLLVHGVQLSDDETALIAGSGAPLVLCPRSNARLGVGRAPVRSLLRHGVSLALGTDSLASVDSLSLWDEIAFATSWFEGELTPAQLLAMATLNGARVLGLEGEMGALHPGWGAHFQVVVLPAEATGAELPEALCAAGSRLRVENLFLGGRDVLPSL